MLRFLKERFVFVVIVGKPHHASSNPGKFFFSGFFFGISRNHRKICPSYKYCLLTCWIQMKFLLHIPQSGCLQDPIILFNVSHSLDRKRRIVPEILLRFRTQSLVVHHECCSGYETMKLAVFFSAERVTLMKFAT